MPYIAWNNGISVQWHDPSENYQLAAGQVPFDHWPSAADLAAAFPGYAAALAASQAPAQFQAALAAGLKITCSTTTALSATYGTQMQDEINWTAVQEAISSSQPWPGYMRDITGAKHTMTNAQATAIAEAILQYITAWDDWYANALAGTVAAPPPSSVTLAI